MMKVTMIRILAIGGVAEALGHFLVALGRVVVRESSEGLANH
jgi:hypothetical protein